MSARSPFSPQRRHARLALIAALLLTLAACASQLKSGARGPTPTTYPTLEPWIPTVTPTTIPYATAAPGTMPHVDGLLYLRSLDGTVSALNPADGSTRWSVALPGSNVGLLATDHAVYAVSSVGPVLALRLSDGGQLWSAPGEHTLADVDGMLLVERQESIAALDAATGATRWMWTPPADDEFEAQLVFGAGVVIIATSVRGGGGGSGYYGLHAIDTHTGVARWNRPRGNAIYGSPFIAGDRIYFSSQTDSTGKLGAYTLSNGATIWERDWSSFNVRDGADVRGADDQHIYASVGESGMAVLRASDGATVWSQDQATSGGGELDLFGLTATSVYAQAGGTITRLDATNGAQIWSQSLGGGAVLVGDMIYLSRQSPDVTYALDAATGAIRWRFPAALSDYAVRNGVLFARVAYDTNAQPQATTGLIYALSTATGALYWKRDLPSSVSSGPFLEP